MEKTTDEEKRDRARKKLRREFGGRSPITRVTPRSSRLLGIETQVEVEKKALSSDPI